MAPEEASDLGRLDPEAIARVRTEAWPDPQNTDELHDSLVWLGFLTEDEAARQTEWASWLEALSRQKRTARLHAGNKNLWIAAERLPQFRALFPDAKLDPAIEVPQAQRDQTWTREGALVEILRGRLEGQGPVAESALGLPLGLPAIDIAAALAALQSEGFAMRGRFSDASGAEEWCERRLLARIHRYTVKRLRAEIEPVSAADYMRFLFSWQHVEASARLTGVDGLREAIAALDGFELGAAAWERAVLPARLDRYDPAMLDMLCLAGEVGWARLSTPRGAGEPPRLAPATPIALFLREHVDAWRALRVRAVQETAPSDAWSPEHLTEDARRVLSLLQSRGASFFDDIRSASSLDRDAARQAIGALVAAGLAASDGFSGLRALVLAAQGRHAWADRGAKFAGRWTAVERAACTAQEAVEIQAWTLLRRYGVVFRRVLAREALAAPWRELVRVYRRLEARGEVRGGRFVSGMSGEQFALPAAIPLMREVRRRPADGGLVAISTADPLNLVGIVTSGERVRAAGRNRLVYRDGVPIALREGDAVRELTPLDSATAADVRTLLTRRQGRAPAVVPVHVRA
jgi:ATP-dependent Lhr-like helicase